MKTLGLDLGSGSIGWALIEKDGNNSEIISIGSRIVPIDGDVLNDFNRGKAITVNADRTAKRSARRTFDRYQMRRSSLSNTLRKHGLYPSDSLIKCDKDKLWKLRSKATTEKISLQELGRVLYHMNQKRGYKPTKSEYSADDTKNKEYLQNVSNRYKILHENKQTIGQYIYSQLLNNPEYRYKDSVYPRVAYMEEYDTIMKCQKQFHSDVLTDELINHIKDDIIFFQRPLKSCKHLVSKCELDTYIYQDKNGKECEGAPKVAPISSPLSQVCKIWESINNIVVTDLYRKEIEITKEQKIKIFKEMNTSDKLSLTGLCKCLGIKDKDNYYFPKQFDGKGAKGLQGNVTYANIRKAFKVNNKFDSKYEWLFRFDLSTVEDYNHINRETGEELAIKRLTGDFINEPFYRLWHTLYSIEDKTELENTLRNQFKIEDKGILDNLLKIDFRKMGYSKKSTRMMRKLYPQLSQGLMYSEACEKVGINHSNSITKKENENRELEELLNPIKKGALRQPIVEKVLNQMVNVVNSIIVQYGKPDEIRVELARELKQSKEKRNEASKAINENERRNQEYKDRIIELGLPGTKSQIKKYRLWEETNKLCIYCNNPVNEVAFLQGIDAEVEHIIPRSLYFDNSFSNIVCSCQKCNQAKGQMTANKFMENKGDKIYDEYVKRVKANNKFTRTKKRLLLTSEIPKDFINRQLGETQYITRKAIEILKTVCHNVGATSGSITDFLRHQWGWDKVLHDINFERYEKSSLVEDYTYTHKEEKHTEKRIIDWNKRVDHRHHAIDALVIACTTQGIIQALNNLSSIEDVNYKDENNEKLSKVAKYAKTQPHFSYEEVKKIAEATLVSYRTGQKLYTTGKRYRHMGGKRKLIQKDIIIPRGRLSEETVYGAIDTIDAKGTAVKRFVIKRPLSEISEKNVDSIVDEHIRNLVSTRLSEYKNNPKEAFATPLYSDGKQTKQIKSVRCFVNSTAMTPIRFNSEGAPISYVKPGSNHHVAIYRNEKGELVEHIATFWHSVERVKYGLPGIIKNPQECWTKILNSSVTYPESFLELLPKDNWTFEFSMQINDMFIIGLSDEAFNDAISSGDKATLAKHLYKVQKLSKMDYSFCLHNETKYDQNATNKEDRRFLRISSLKGLVKENLRKVRISSIGNIEPV